MLWCSLHLKTTQMKKTKTHFAHETLATIVAGLTTLAIILCMAITLSSCQTTYSGMGRQVAPMVHDYDVKEIKFQANSNGFSNR